MANFDKYLPLLQSLIGALGGFAVAAFTVWISNRHASAREERQAHRARNAELRAMLREKLEALATSCEASYGGMLADTQYLLLAMQAQRDRRPPPAKPSADHSISDSVSAAVVTARIYFPSIAESVYELHRQLRDYALEVSERASAAIAAGTLVFERPDIAKIKALRLAILDEARRLIENDLV